MNFLWYFETDTHTHTILLHSFTQIENTTERTVSDSYNYSLSANNIKTGNVPSTKPVIIQDNSEKWARILENNEKKFDLRSNRLSIIINSIYKLFDLNKKYSLTAMISSQFRFIRWFICVEMSKLMKTEYIASKSKKKFNSHFFNACISMLTDPSEENRYLKQYFVDVSYADFEER